MNKTTEALKTGKLGDHEIGTVEGSRLVFAKGPQFLDEYMTKFIMPRRFDTAQMILGAFIQKGGHEMTHPIEDLVHTAYVIADEFLLQERPTMDAVLERYWERYMSRQTDTDTVMDKLAEESKSYHL